MPIFEYRCRQCDQISEFITFGRAEDSSESGHTRTCPQCGSPSLEKLISAPSKSPRFAPTCDDSGCGVHDHCGGPAPGGGCNLSGCGKRTPS